jgi:hypothetical protein
MEEKISYFDSERILKLQQKYGEDIMNSIQIPAKSNDLIFVIKKLITHLERQHSAYLLLLTDIMKGMEETTNIKFKKRFSEDLKFRGIVQYISREVNSERSRAYSALGKTRNLSKKVIYRKGETLKG